MAREMDLATYALVLALGAACSATLMSGWLLRLMVSEGMFWALILTNMASAPVGILLPSCCSRRRDLDVVPTVNLVLATLVTISVDLLIVTVDWFAFRQVPVGELMTHQVDHLVRTLIAVVGVATAISLLIFLVHFTAVQEAAHIFRFCRKLQRWSRWAPKARLQVCDDLEKLAPGDCAICLDKLTGLPECFARAPPDEAKAIDVCARGLLRMPCGHIFHGSCADRWIVREVTCPMCRRSISGLGDCVRLCLPRRGGSAATPGGRESEEFPDWEASHDHPGMEGPTAVEPSAVLIAFTQELEAADEEGAPGRKLGLAATGAGPSLIVQI